MSNPTIALIGRPNVGKSTLFNRLTKSRNAIVADMPGVTRDRQYGIAHLGKRQYILVDTGGFEPLIDSGIMYQMARHTEAAVLEADSVIFIVDGRSGMAPQDKIIANKLRTLNKPIHVAVNKSEGREQVLAISDFYALGLNNLYAISSSNGDGILKLMEHILDELPNEVVPEQDKGISFAIVGRPNVGKSTLVNAMLGEERVIVFDEAGTTRDSINIAFEKFGQRYTIIDTAGIRRRGKIEDKIEKFSVIKSLQAISDAQVVVLVLDAQLDIAEQDAHIIGYALDAGKSIVVVINKWDSLSAAQRLTIKQDIQLKLHFLDFAQFHYISALQKKGIQELFTAINQTYASAFIKLTTPKLTRVLLEALNRQPPVYKGNFKPKMKYAHQGGSNPPVIVIHGNSLDKVAKSYTKYLERTFQKTFNLIGTPIRIEYKTKTNPFEDK